MNPELEQQLEEIHALAKDNHRMLRAIRRGQWMSFFSTIIVWIVVLALPLYLYREYLEPVVSKISEISGMASTTTSGFLGLPSSTEIEKLINSYTGSQ